MGGKSTSCSNSTTKVWVECAYFKPEEILPEKPENII